MSLHHVIRTGELDPTSFTCIYCAENSDMEWDSEFMGEHHYKSFICEHCGSTNTLKVEFQGSGHDDFGVESLLG